MKDSNVRHFFLNHIVKVTHITHLASNCYGEHLTSNLIFFLFSMFIVYKFLECSYPIFQSNIRQSEHTSTVNP